MAFFKNIKLILTSIAFIWLWSHYFFKCLDLEHQLSVANESIVSLSQKISSLNADLAEKSIEHIDDLSNEALLAPLVIDTNITLSPQESVDEFKKPNKPNKPRLHSITISL